MNESADAIKNLPTQRLKENFYLKIYDLKYDLFIFKIYIYMYI